MKEVYQLLWTFAGAVVGIAVGWLAYLGVYNLFPEVLGTNGTLNVIAIFGLVGGGVLSFGSLAVWTTTKREKARRRKERQAKTKCGGKRRK